MESHVGLIMSLVVVWFLILTQIFTLLCANDEGDWLSAFRASIIDPGNVLQSWKPSLINPCTWFHITCDSDNYVIRVDLGNAGLSGTISSTLGNLAHLQYLELHNNNLSGTIPPELGNLTNLLSLDLYNNILSGELPSTFDNLTSLRFLRLQNNSLDGCVRFSTLNQLRKNNPNIIIMVFEGNPNARACVLN